MNHCARCGGSFDIECKLCIMFAAGRAPGVKVEGEAIPDDTTDLGRIAYDRDDRSTSADWQVSEALAVHPKQVTRANARNKRHGIGTRYDKAGFAHIPSRSDRKKLLKLEGLKDNKGGYGD